MEPKEINQINGIIEEKHAYSIPIQINGQKAIGLMDTGAEAMCISENYLTKLTNEGMLQPEKESHQLEIYQSSDRQSRNNVLDYCRSKNRK